MSDIASTLPSGIELCSYVSFHWAKRSSNDPGLGLVDWYLQNWQAHLRWAVDDKTGKARPFDRTKVVDFCERNIRGYVVPADEWRSAKYFGCYGSKDKKGISPWTLTGGFQNSSWGSKLLLTWPLTDGPTWAALAGMLRDAAGSPSLTLAHGGLTYSHSVFDSSDGRRRHATVPRFWGMDAPELTEDAYAAVDGCRSPSWLTYVPSEKLARLVPGALERLPAEITQTRLESGILFQLGPAPILGDQNRGEPMPLHRALARALKPIRGELTHWTNSTSYKYPTWVARFDEPETETRS
jgi:hypothetical protein